MSTYLTSNMIFEIQCHKRGTEEGFMSQGRLDPLFLEAYPASNGTHEPIK